MNQIQVFKYNAAEVRTVMRDGEPWWVLKDVCDVLGLGSPHKVAERLDEDEKGRNLIPTLGGEQEVSIVNEPGLYSVILRSDKPEAKAFKRWITHEVLPSIRKTGKYSTAAISELEAMKIQAQRDRAVAMKLNAQVRMFNTLMQTTKDKNLSPIAVEVFGLKAIEKAMGVDVGNYLPQTEKTYSATEVGKMLGVTAHKIGIAANRNGLKTDLYGITVMDKSPHSAKEVPNFRYNAAGVSKLGELLGARSPL